MAQSPAITAASQAAMQAVVDIADKSSNNIHPKSVDDAKPALEAAITKAIAADPVVQNATNTEAHFWQKRTFWSALASTGAALSAGVVAALNYMAANTSQDGSKVVSAMTIGFAIWAGYSAARAGIATTPLGTPSVPKNPVSYRG